MKLLKTSEKERILKSIREKKFYPIQNKDKKRMITEFLLETMQARRQRNIVKVEKEKP